MLQSALKQMKTDIAASRIIAWNCFVETILFVWAIPRAFSLKMWTYSSTLLVYICNDLCWGLAEV